MTKHILVGLLLIFSIAGQSQETVNKQVTISWPHNNTEDPTASYSGTDADYFKPDYYQLGSNLNFNSVRSSNGTTFRTYRPNTQSGAGPTNLISFNIVPVTGLTFLPSQLSFKAQRYGTDSGLIDVNWVSDDGTVTIIETGLKPARDNSGNITDVSYDLSGLSIPEMEGNGRIDIYLYDLGNTKESGFADINVTGQLTGTVIQVNTYTLNVTSIPEMAGSIELVPNGQEFDEGTLVDLTATANFGYEFSHWENSIGETLSTVNPLNFEVITNEDLKAVFNAVPTYSLSVTTEGGAPDYMIDYSPVGVTVNSERTYEENTSVTLTARENPVLSFTNWSTGETALSVSVDMIENKNLIATYSPADFIVGWDFYQPGNQGRPADFYSKDENQSSSLILRDAAGNTSSWLDKSTVAAGGYEAAEGAAVNWNDLSERFYYQISFNASDFVDVEVSADMLFNFNAYSRQIVEYSLDGLNFTEIGSYTMSTAKILYPGSFSLPAAANNQSEVFIRWIPDYSSPLVGSTSTNDGTTISAIYVHATEQIADDGTAPVLVSTVPEDNSSGASASGRIVLNFDERISIEQGVFGIVNGKELEPEVIGKSILFPYKGLEYSTEYTFELAGNTVSDLTANSVAEPIRITFTTLSKPTVAKKAYDFIVGTDGNFSDALSAAQSASGSGERFIIFFPNGEYDLGNLTGDATQQTFIGIPKLSLIGQSAEGVILFNEPSPENEGIGTTPTINLQSNSDDIYMQDLTILNKMDYRSGSFLGRAVALRDQGDRNIYVNVRLLSNQDTYYTGGGRTYWEGGEIHGTVDFIFGDGDIFFNEVLLYLEDRTNNHVTAAATRGNWGYVFNNCTIDGFSTANGNYKLGRPWQNGPRTVYLNTRMNLLPSGEGWSQWNVHPVQYAEYNSITSSGSTVSLSNRRSTYSDGSSTVSLNPVLTDSEAAEYTVDNVLGGSDDWNPVVSAEQIQKPFISLAEGKLTWPDNAYTLGWAVFKDGNFLTFTTANEYTPAEGVNSGVYYIRAANEMGGLSEASNPVDLSKGLTSITWDSPASIVYGTVLGEVQLNATIDGSSAAPLYEPAIGTLLNAGEQKLKVFIDADEQFNSAYAEVMISVTKAASTIEWTQPDPIVETTALSAEQLNAVVTGTSAEAVYSPSAGTFLEPGTQILSVTFAEDQNYQAASATVNIEVTADPTLSVNKGEMQFSVYPNPVGTGMVSVSSTNPLIAVSLFTLQGQLIKAEKLNDNTLEFRISVEDLPEGTYIIKLESSEGSKSRLLKIKK